MPHFHKHSNGSLVANTATMVGDIDVGTGVNVWFGASLRGDVARITLGDFVNVQDNAVVHCDFDVPLTIEAGVVVGHSAIVHGVFVGHDTLVGMGATILGGTTIGAESIVAAGSVVPPNKTFPPRSMLMGVPAKLVRTVTDEEVELTKATNRRYRELSAAYLRGEFGS
jgi:carbonic anhydrase/acetyltransferase-like protein (isoleucine patch superfamily)